MTRPLGATYRLQLGADLDLEAATGLVGYLHDLGAGTVYLSPVMAAAPGSTHGYDVVDPEEVSPELGGADALRALGVAARDAGLGVLLDIVPNHMSTHPAGPWWRDVLRWGPWSRYASVFDIEWEPPECPHLRHKVLVPVLDKPLEDVLAAGELEVGTGIDGEPAIRWHDHDLPLRPGVAGGDTAELLEAQHWALEFWRTGRNRVNFRRFFGLQELVGVRQEDPPVREATHGLVRRLVEEGTVTALRVDHVDGLADPAGYLRWLGEVTGSVPVVVEKILEPGEALPGGWPVDGTTGYDFLTSVAALFVDPDGDRRLHDLHRRLGGPASFDEVARDAQRDIIERLFAADLDAVVAAAAVGAPRGVTVAGLCDVVVESTMALPVYRTYLADGPATPTDRALVESALDEAVACGAPPAAAEHLRRVLLSSGDGAGPGGDGPQAAWAAARTRWQQLTGPVMAKGVEDTACYAHVAVLGRNEVGGRGQLEGALAAFHRLCAQRARRWPGTLNASATHDTKRGEDTRLRMLALTELDKGWAVTVERWQAVVGEWWAAAGGAGAGLEPTDALILYQTLVAAWPDEPDEVDAFAGRLADYCVKAAREAKRRTSWLDPDEAYEEALAEIARRAVTEPPLADEARQWAGRLSWYGSMASLAQVVLKVAAPGVPDLYQGCELWDLSLVDPDNRRAVDFERRRQMLAELDATSPPLEELVGSWRDGRVKLWVTSRALRARRQAAELFQAGDFVPLAVTGPRSAETVAFARGSSDGWAVTVAGRLSSRWSEPGVPVEGQGWAGTEARLPGGAPSDWVDALSGRALSTASGLLDLGDVMGPLPAALLLPR